MNLITHNSGQSDFSQNFDTMYVNQCMIKRAIMIDQDPTWSCKVEKKGNVKVPGEWVSLCVFADLSNIAFERAG